MQSHALVQAVAAAAEMCPAGQPTCHTHSVYDLSQQTMKRNGTLLTGILNYCMQTHSEWNLDENVVS